jgi:predicted ribosome quality control (RQC) complex YloA/Tae2 family protein
MGFRKRKNIELYSSLEEISIYRFDKIINGDLRYLANVENVTNVKISEAYKESWKKLYNEYASKTKNNTIVRVYLLLGEINYLSLRLKVVPMLIDIMISSTDIDIFNMAVEEINKWGFFINKEKPMRDEINKITKALNNSITKIKRKKSEYKELTKEKQESLSLIQQKIKLEVILGIKIDVKRESVLDWLSYWDEVKIITERKKKSLVNG